MKNFILKISAMCVLLMCGVQAMAQNYPTYTIYESGKEGYKSFRIPAIIKNKQGDLLAFAEGRVNGSNDFGNIKIVLKKSADGGKTWSAIKVVAHNESLTAGNPAPVLDATDPRYPQGRIFVFFNTSDAHEMEMREGAGVRRVMYVTSTDGGDSWSAPVDITNQVHLMNKPKLNPEWNHAEDWRTYANTPGHAIQFKGGKYNDRIYVAANHSAGEPRPQLRDYQAHGFYTDDHGDSFKVSESVPYDGSNESTACQIGKKGLMINSRNQTGTYRIVSVSNDGGATWAKTYVDAQLPDPICEGSILNIGKKRGKDVLAFCNAGNTHSRDSLTLRLSYDLGKTWKVNKLVSPTPPEAKESSAYSDLVMIDPKTIGVMYEKDMYSKIVLVQVDLSKEL